MDGILIVDKPRGLTSHDVVNHVRRLTGQRRVGHAGTLDPLATGVLVLCVGQATRLAEYVAGCDKTYRAEIVLGVTTDTYDADGHVTGLRPVEVALDQIQIALSSFVGDILQTPPAFSAIKQGGEPLYRAARSGEAVTLAPRPVHIAEIRLLDYKAPLLVVEVDCSKGTYIRSLAHDLGQRLGCGAHLSALVRLRSGRFSLADAASLEDLALAARHGRLDQFLLAPDQALLDTPAVTLDATGAARACRGMGVAVAADGAAPAGTRLCRAYDPAGNFLAVGQLDLRAGWWQPQKVFRTCK